MSHSTTSLPLNPSLAMQIKNILLQVTSIIVLMLAPACDEAPGEPPPDAESDLMLDGSWSFLSNNLESGTIQFSVMGNQFTGSVNAGTQGWSFSDGVISFDDDRNYIQFTRGSGEAQVHRGWVSADGAFIGGYFEFGSKRRPWYAQRSGSLPTPVDQGSVSTAADLAGTWQILLNDGSTGTIDLSVSGASLSGQVAAGSLSWPLTGTASVGTEEIKVSFTRGSGEAQQYEGWVSAGGAFISGYFAFGSKERPWFAWRE